jgi:hypothetical protein
MQTVCFEVAVVAMLATGWTLAFAPACLMFAWNLLSAIHCTFIKPSAYMPQWRTTPLRDQDWDWDIPEEGVAIADRVRALGLMPMIEYLDDDPFLFVRVNGQRVYLYHWK